MALPKRPTDLAKVFFDKGFEEALRARQALDYIYTQSPQNRAMFEMAQAIGSLARGLTELSTGLRATYMAVEKLGGGGGEQAAGGGMFGPDFVKNIQAMQTRAIQDAIAKVVRTIADAGGNLANIAGLKRP